MQVFLGTERNGEERNGPVHVVDGEGPVVFSVPGKARETHSNVAPWHLQHHIKLLLILLQPNHSQFSPHK